MNLKNSNSVLLQGFAPAELPAIIGSMMAMNALEHGRASSDSHAEALVMMSLLNGKDFTQESFRERVRSYRFIWEEDEICSIQLNLKDG